MNRRVSLRLCYSEARDVSATGDMALSTVSSAQYLLLIGIKLLHDTLQISHIIVTVVFDTATRKLDATLDGERCAVVAVHAWLPNSPPQMRVYLPNDNV